MMRWAILYVRKDMAIWININVLYLAKVTSMVGKKVEYYARVFSYLRTTVCLIPTITRRENRYFFFSRQSRCEKYSFCFSCFTVLKFGKHHFIYILDMTK